MFVGCSMNYSFTIETEDGKTYECERVVEGKRKLYQTIHVKGIGSRRDSARYGRAQTDAPIETMPFNARIIAVEIVRFGVVDS